MIQAPKRPMQMSLPARGREQRVSLDAGYTGVAAKRSIIKAMPEGPLKELKQALERMKAQIHSRVEHPFHVIKNVFGHWKVRYKGLAKNTAQQYELFALTD
jgi:transposase, IS5 family